MSTLTVVNNTGNQAQFDYDISKIFIFKNRYVAATFINLSGGTLSYAPGTLVGRVAASNKITKCDSAATDGSQIPIGVLKSTITALVDDGEVAVNFCNSGDVVEDKLVFTGAETLATVVTVKGGAGLDVANTNVRTLGDMLRSLGINIIESTENNVFDNQ